jgi:hypothetical protein
MLHQPSFAEAFSRRTQLGVLMLKMNEMMKREIITSSPLGGVFVGIGKQQHLISWTFSMCPHSSTFIWPVVGI